MSWFGWGKIAPPNSIQSRIGAAALEVAKLEIGRGEVGVNNEGPDLDRYRRGGPAGPWCASFVMFCLEEGCHNLGITCSINRTHSARRLFARCVAAGERVARPVPGDVVCWSRGVEGSWTGHIGIVSRVPDEDGSFWAICGNQGSFPSKVREYLHELGEANLIGFARLL